MSIVGDHLSEWQAAGLLDAESCARIAQYEQAKKPARSAQPVLIELFAYLGLIIVGAGVVVLVAVNWDRLGGVARIATLALPGIALLPLGRLLSTSREQGLRRGGSIAWLLALTLVTGAVGVTGHELAWDGESAALAAGIVSLASRSCCGGSTGITRRSPVWRRPPCSSRLAPPLSTPGT